MTWAGSGQESRPSAKNPLAPRGLYFGWSCMSRRHAADRSKVQKTATIELNDHRLQVGGFTSCRWEIDCHRPFAHRLAFPPRYDLTPVLVRTVRETGEHGRVLPFRTQFPVPTRQQFAAAGHAPSRMPHATTLHQPCFAFSPCPYPHFGACHSLDTWR